mgnify:CR=1 FL=1
MAAQSWLDYDVNEVATLLAKEAVARDLVKAAALPTLADIGQQVGEFGANFGNKAREYGGQALNWLNEPGSEGLRYGLAGAGVGGLLGLGSQLHKDPEERQYGSAALTGALSGGAMGAGAGLLRQNSSGLFGDGSQASPPAEAPQPTAKPPAVKDDAGSAGVDAATAGAAAGEGSAPLSVDEQLKRVNQGIAEGQQQQGVASSENWKRTAKQLAGGAAVTAGADQFLRNRPTALLGRGVDAAVEGGMKGYSPEAQIAITRIKNAPSELSLNRGLLSAYFDPQLPRLGKSLRGYVRQPQMAADSLAASRASKTEFSRGRLLADPTAMNPYFPGLRNSEVRKLGGPLHQGLRPSYLGGTAAAAAGLIPIIMALMSDQKVQQQQQAIAKGFSGN